MSNALESSMKNINAVVKAAGNIQSQEQNHREHRRKVEEEMRRHLAEQDRIRKQELEDEKDDALVDQLLPKVAEIVNAKGERFITKGYLQVFRGVAHVLPRELKFTVRGMNIIHRCLALVPGTSLLMQEEWTAASEDNISETARHEAEKAARNEQIAIEEARIVSGLRDAIVYLIRNRIEFKRKDGSLQLVCKSYNGLYHNLLSVLRDNTKIRGIRAMRLIHEAMVQELQWSHHWAKFMESDMAKAEIREQEFRKARRERSNTVYDAYQIEHPGEVSVEGNTSDTGEVPEVDTDDNTFDKVEVSAEDIETAGQISDTEKAELVEAMVEGDHVTEE